MNQDEVLHIFRQALIVTTMIGGPILIGILIIGFIVAVFQAMTQINELTLSFIPKLIMIAITIVFAGHWMMSTLGNYSTKLFEQIPIIIGIQ